MFEISNLKIYIRVALENLTHKIVFRRRMCPPFNDVKFYATTEGGLRYLKPNLTNLDPCLFNLANTYVKAGATVWDIGANLGIFTLSAAKLVGTKGNVFAIEADSYMYRLLRRSVKLNSWHDRVTVLSAACSDRVGVGRFVIAKRSRSTNYIEGFGTTQTGGIRDIEYVPLVTLDSLLEVFLAPDLIKIDVEGAEILVLQGASKVLLRGPILILEVASESSDAVRSILDELDYEYFDGETGLRAEVGTLPYSTVAIPKTDM